MIKDTIQQLTLFCGVGAINTGISLLIILLLSGFLSVHYVVANIIGYAFGIASGFIMHKKMTFKSQTPDKSVKAQLLLFMTIFAIGYIAQLGLLVLLVEKIHLDNVPSQIIAWCFYVGVSFTGHKFFTFDGGKHE